MHDSKELISTFCTVLSPCKGFCASWSSADPTISWRASCSWCVWPDNRFLVIMLFCQLSPRTPWTSPTMFAPLICQSLLTSQFSSSGCKFSFLKDSFLLLQSHLPCQCWLLFILPQFFLDTQLPVIYRTLHTSQWSTEALCRVPTKN